MCGGKNFKNIWVGLSVGKAGLCQDAMNCLPRQSPLTFWLQSRPIFSRNCQGCSVVLRLPVTFCSYKFVAAFEAEMCRLALALSTKQTLASSHFTRHDL
jgi:hypothetical protein